MWERDRLVEERLLASPVEWTRFAYDAESRLSRAEQGDDEAGVRARWRFVRDADGRVIEERFDVEDDEFAEQTRTFGYDAQGRLVRDGSSAIRYE